MYLHNLHLLPMQLIESLVHALQMIKKAKQSNLQTIDIGKETLRDIKPERMFCIASTPAESLRHLPSSIHSVFQLYSCKKGSLPVNSNLRIECSLLSTGFKNVTFIKNSLLAFLQYENIGLSLLECIFDRAMEHLGTLSTADYSTVGECLMYSSVAQTVMATKLEQGFGTHVLTPSRQRSAKRTVKLQGITEEDEDEEYMDESGVGDDDLVLQSQRVEVLSLLIAMWELQPSSISGSMNSSLVKAFPEVDVESVFQIASDACNELIQRYPWTRDLVESVQESRATSVMYNDNSDTKGTDMITYMQIHY